MGYSMLSATIPIVLTTLKYIIGALSRLTMRGGFFKRVVTVGALSIFPNGLFYGEQKREVIILVVKASENDSLIHRLAEKANVKPSKVERVLRALEGYVELPDFPEECTYTFSHTRYWCHNSFCRES